ncbi:glycosyltransferase family 4 protein [Pseudalkalibacillus hwajinpoensis]|uniref:glycosyltransferase family 4 protein n=1 Tax=Guptibacillus hwajinpoensis TaxID=208199 RepID=UPI001CFDB84A|nr:glycosyltransferase family 4 protein [Pseudalkalibacillus hwajinpoensis]
MPAKKVLFCATVDYHFKAFHLPYLKWFKEEGWEVHIAASGELKLPYTDRKFNIPIQRSPFQMKNIEAYKELKRIMDKNHYDIIHCHTPMGGVLSRIAARKTRSQGTKVIYTAHGFHFCKGSPLLNWFVYYPIEKKLANDTDWLITINQEDYQLALKRFNATQVEYVKGVGIDSNVFTPLIEEEKRKRKESFGYHPDDFLLFYAAEFNQNKNQKYLLEALVLLKEKLPQVKLLLAGKGPLLQSCQTLSHTLGISDHVDFLGFRDDLKELVPMCDIAVASSLREGLPVNIMEAMSCELPVVAVDNRGHKELVVSGKTGWLVQPESPEQLAAKVNDLAMDEVTRRAFGKSGRKRILSDFNVDQILQHKRMIYTSCIQGTEEVNWALQ